MAQSLSALGGLLPGAQVGRTKDERAQLRQVSQQFEAIFLDQLFKAMRDTTLKSGLFGQDRTMEMYQEMRDEALAQTIATSGGGLGIGAMIEKDLGRHLKP